MMQAAPLVMMERSATMMEAAVLGWKAVLRGSAATTGRGREGSPIELIS
jgi:hypothetical protein